MPFREILTVQRVVEITGGKLAGSGENFQIDSIRSLDMAGPRDLSFLSNPKYRYQLQSTQAGVILMDEPVKNASFQIIIVDDPYTALAKVLDIIDQPILPDKGIHPTAVIHETAKLGRNVRIAPFVTIGKNVQIGDETVVFPGTVIGDQVTVRTKCIIYPNVTIYHNVKIGDRVIIHAGAVIGSDGFGYSRYEGEFRKIPQIGKVIIGSDVEIGAGTTIDRGSLKDTYIEDGAKLDNLIQVAHNVKIGRYSALAALVGIAGSTDIGSRVVIGGQTGINGHIKIGDDITLAAKTGVTKSISDPGIYAGFPAVKHREWLKKVVEYSRLDRLKKKVKSLEGKIESIEKTLNDHKEN